MLHKNKNSKSLFLTTLSSKHTLIWSDITVKNVAYVFRFEVNKLYVPN